MPSRVYLDYNSSTPLDRRVREAMLDAECHFGNPSSIHAEGREARALIDEARLSVARLLGCDHRRLVFTSGGTEANNLAILGAARANKFRGDHLVTTAIEHSSVLNAFHQLEREGFRVTYLAPDHNGLIDPRRVAGALLPETILVSVMMANNEIGTIQEVKEIARLAHEQGVIVHTDAVQALGKIAVQVEEVGADLVSISAHKIYGPKGVGALYYDVSVTLVSLLRGGTHEGGLRAGTENAVGIHGFGVAAEILIKDGIPDLLPLRVRLEDGLTQTPLNIICREAPRLPNTTNFYSKSWLGESMVMAFDLEGVSVSNGSACSAGIIEPSHVILSLGYNEDVARSVIRVSSGKFTTQNEIDRFLEVVGRLHGLGVTE
jgi:cysteine desulfurase